MQLANTDNDFGSGGAMLLPDQKMADGNVKHLAVAAGKDNKIYNKIYVVDRDAMGKFNPTSNTIWQVLTGALAGGIWGSPAYFNGTLYYGGLNDHIKALPVTKALLATTAASRSPTALAYPGAVPAIPANGTSNTILWPAETARRGHCTRMTPPIWDASSTIAIRRARATSGARATSHRADESRGKVYVGATNGVAVPGLRQ